MSYTIEKITEHLELGEGPHWDEETQSLYFVDIHGKSIHKYTPSTNTHSKAVLGGKTVSFIIPVEGSSQKFVVAYGNELSIATWDGVTDKINHIETLVELKDTDTTTYRWNDGKSDSQGRLWAGVLIPKPEGGFYPNQGCLYTLQSNRSLKKQVDRITLTNGLAWNDSVNKFYYIDSGAGVVYQFDYDSKNCAISNQQVLFTLNKHGISGLPDGMTIDTDGNLWVACFGGSKVIKINPRLPETLLQSIELPAEQITSVVFGGKDLDELFVTTAKIKLFGTNHIPEGPGHGVVYRITGLGVKGFPSFKVKLQ